MIFRRKTYFEKERVKINKLTDYVQTSEITIWYFLFIPIFKMKDVYQHTL